MAIKKRCLLWDYTNTQDRPQQMDIVKFDGPISSVSNWNSWVPPELKGRAPFRPMIHLERELNGNEWQLILQSDQPIVHFFNEPERNGISPQKAADYWRNQVVPALRNERKKQLVSPSCASDPAGQQWISDFMSLIQDALPDYLGLHWYGTSSDECKQYISNMHDKFPGLKIIVSEIASISRDYEQVHAFTRDMCNWMDGVDFVVEYGFFGCMKNMPDDFVSPAARLMDQWGNFTDLMWKYMSDQPMI
ncbi:glycoside hydrolase family 128 protein [Zopfia rhizophila CBS 207.26]|uniref:Glycoside hydrolase family 128 protein n=1 Tax=Zopfia rhizophila CBS 207.26 TaxID=1314779 RepID=A0A6A6E2C1_9PEZI|nr:glycoside hydrolase family 128 protein [Zopfia rhizophila CBS 207.26]